MELTESFILSQAPNPAAAENGRKLSRKGSFSGHHKDAGGTLFWADCAGSGKTPYHVSIDLSGGGDPVCRCSCPSRQFPCKHALGLYFEMLAEKDFAVADIPQDIAEKRQKQAQRAEKQAERREKAAKSPPKPASAAAQKKKLDKQLQGLDQAERMVDELLTAGVATMAGASAQTYEKLAKELGNYYLTGAQTAFERIALTVRSIQKDPEQAEQCYAQALQILIALHSTIKRSRAFLQQKLDAKAYSAEDTVLFEAMGGVWRLEDLHAVGAYRENVRLVQLAFDVSYDEAKREYVERGWWIDLGTGRIDQTRNLRPVKAMKYIKAEDSRFDLLEVPILYTYPGEGSCRIRWEDCASRSITPEEQAALPALAQPDLAAAVKMVKGQIKNTLLPKYAPVLVPIGQLGTVGEEFVLEDAAGGRIQLRDRREDGADHASTARLAMLPEAVPPGSALFGLMFYDNADGHICLHPYSLVTPRQTIRLLY